MTLMQWRDDLRTGIASIDHEHEALIRQINELDQALSAGAGGASGGDLFGALYASVSAHFALEERLMRNHHYDQVAEHKAEHERLLDEIRDLMEAYDQGGDAVYDQAFAERLRNWFMIHFSSTDARLYRALGARLTLPLPLAQNRLSFS